MLMGDKLRLNQIMLNILSNMDALNRVMKHVMEFRSSK